MNYSKKTATRLVLSILLMLVSVFGMNRSLDPKATAGFAPAGILEADDSLAVMSSSATRESVEEEMTFADNCQILIYHTHTNEAYLANGENRFEKLASRSENAGLTVKQVGNVLSEALAAYGYDTYHDITNHEAKGYSYAYKSSAALINSLTQQNGKYKVHIDLHRDAYIKNTIPTVEINGESVARVMLVVGGECDTAKENHEFAKRVAEEMNKIKAGFCEKVLYVATSGYNQEHSDRSLLIEVGDNAVTIEEASRAAQYVAVAIGKVLAGE